MRGKVAPRHATRQGVAKRYAGATVTKHVRRHCLLLHEDADRTVSRLSISDTVRFSSSTTAMRVMIEYAFLIVSVACIPAGIVCLGIWMAKNSKRALVAGVIALGLAGLGYARLSYSEFWRVDRCLDSGGSYNKVQRTCER